MIDTNRAQFVFLYGPPAAGKYTIAKALAAELSWPLFHNHLAINYVESVIKWGEPGFHQACADVRVALVQRALENSTSLVSTFVYAKGFDVDDAFVERLRCVVKDASARFCAVRLTCSMETLRARCVASHRALMKKIATVESLQSVLEQYDCFSQLQDIDSLTIDTDMYSVVESVAQIRLHFHL
jgi:tRNA uridine 5-carbamoylmethylation protein Kti12